MQSAPLTRRSILAQAWPIMLGQTTVPLVGLVDTAVIGWTGDAAALAGVALGTAIISFIFWAFGFLRMGMTGLTAQAHGRGARGEVDGLLVRGVVAGHCASFRGGARIVRRPGPDDTSPCGGDRVPRLHAPVPAI